MRNVGLTQKEQPIQCIQFATPTKITSVISHFYISPLVVKTWVLGVGAGQNATCMPIMTSRKSGVKINLDVCDVFFFFFFFYKNDFLIQNETRAMTRFISRSRSNCFRSRSRSNFMKTSNIFLLLLLLLVLLDVVELRSGKGI